MPTKKPSLKEFSPDISLPFLGPLEPLAPPSPPTFPRFEDLVREETERQATTKTKPLMDLVSAYLPDPSPLLEDFQKNPKRYGVETHELLGQLMQGSKSVEHLSPNERTLLNRATFDYFQTAPAKPVERNVRSTKTAATAQRTSRIRKPRPPRTARTELPDFWWLA